jgi:hypothetical protein
VIGRHSFFQKIARTGGAVTYASSVPAAAGELTLTLTSPLPA